MLMICDIYDLKDDVVELISFISWKKRSPIALEMQSYCQNAPSTWSRQWGYLELSYKQSLVWKVSWDKRSGGKFWEQLSVNQTFH